MSIEVLVLTWNVGNKQPNTSELETWLPADGGDYDIVAVGTQENDFKEKSVDDEVDDDDQEVSSADVVVESKEVTRKHRAERLAAAKAASKSESLWDQMVAARLGSGYSVINHQVMREMRLTLYAKNEHLEGSTACISGIQVGQSATGIGGVIANKGGILIKLDYAQTSLAFISCHLAAHSHKLQRRNSDCQEILEETQAVLTYPQVDAVHQFDHVFWIGDLNYRVDLNLVAPTSDEVHFQKVTELINGSDWKNLMAADQLRSSQAKGEAFAGFSEGDYAFAPTFKVERQEGMNYKNKRIPSYCDRILWKSMPALKGNVEQNFLRSAPGVTTSDHKPVFSAFSITPSPAISHAPAGMQPPLIQVSEASVDGVSSTDKTYLVFLTNPAGLLGDLKQKPPQTKVVPSGTSTTTPGKLRATWTSEQCPLLRPLVTEPSELASVTLIVAVYDADVLSKDDLLGTVLVPLIHPDGAAAMSEGDEYELKVKLPIVKGMVSADQGTLQATVKVSYGAKLAPALEAAVGMPQKAGAPSSSGGCCLVQ